MEVPPAAQEPHSSHSIPAWEKVAGKNQLSYEPLITDQAGLMSALQEEQGQKWLSQPHVGLLIKVNAPRGEAMSAAGAALGLRAGKLLWHLKQQVLQLCGDFLEGKILNLFCALMKLGALKWGVILPLMSPSFCCWIWRELVAFVDLAGAGAHGCCLLFPVGVDANKSCCSDPRG